MAIFSNTYGEEHNQMVPQDNLFNNIYSNNVYDENASIDDKPDKQMEACGVFGIYGPELDVAKLTYFGLYALQHRGQESAGIATFDGQEVCFHKDMGLVSQVFNESILSVLTGNLAIGHTRYSTTGSSLKANAQPILKETRLGKVAIAHNGNLVNTIELRQKLEQKGYSFLTTTDSEMIALAIADEVNQGKPWLEGAISAFQLFSGVYSLTIATPEGLMGVRDPYGVRPLVIGTLKSEESGQTRYVLASETCGLDIIGAEYLRDVEPGELVWITEAGLASFHWEKQQKRKLCIFEMIYFARPDSLINDESLYSYRVRLGKELAKEYPIEADLVVGVPDSGIPAAIGYSRQSGIGYGEALIKNRYVGRTFIKPTHTMRETGIKMKLNPLKDALVGKRIVIIDDSIVRGNTSSKIITALREAGAKEVHMRISSPPVTHPCFYGIDTDTQDHLIAATKSPKEIEKAIGVDSLGYLSWEGMLRATGEDPESFCSACFTGDYPIDIPDHMKQSKLLLEKAH